MSNIYSVPPPNSHDAVNPVFESPLRDNSFREILDPAEARRHFSKLGLAYLIMTVAHLSMILAVQFVVRFAYPLLLTAWWFRWVLSLLPLYGVGLPVLLLCLRRVPKSPHNGDFTHRQTTEDKPAFRLRHWLILLVIAFGCMTAGGIVGNVMMNMLSAVMQYDYAFALNGMVDESPLWFTFLCTCVFAPVGEELLYRKLLIDRTRRFGDLISILLSGLLFGLFHGNLFQFFYAAMVGMVLAYVYTRSGKIGWCMAMHAAINLMGTIVVPSIAKLIPPDLMSFDGVISVLAYLTVLLWEYGMLLAAIVLFAVFISRVKLSRGAVSVRGADHAAVALLNSGIMAYVVIQVLFVITNLIPAY